MKLNIFINDYFIKYNSQQAISKSIDLSTIEKLIGKEYQIILRGEPTLHKDYKKLIDLIKKQDYIMMLEGKNIESLLSFNNPPPYLSFYYDGFINDRIRCDNDLTNNIIKVLNFYKSKKYISRLNYTISPLNKDWFYADIALLKNFLHIYPQMKNPYFSIYQKGIMYAQPEARWTNVDRNMIDYINLSGIMSQTNLDFFLNYISKQSYSCKSPEKSLTIMPDSTVRLCMSHRIGDIIGDLKSQSIDEIILSSEDIRKEAKTCPYRQSCWLSYNIKDSVHI